MKSKIKNLILAVLVLTGLNIYAQNNRRNLDNFRQPDQRGINTFEAPKDTETTFDGVKVRVGGASTLQFQDLRHENSGAVPLGKIGSNFNLATANLDLDVALADGVRMHLRTYLSSRHHPEPYVKGGYFQIDKLDFISEGLLSDLMQYTTIKIGHMENNYGDAHFRRSDNAQTIYNPFIGNLIMDSFTTEVGAEVYYRREGFLGMVGFSNGKLNQSVVAGSNGKTGGAAFLAKLGYDKQLNDDLRVRLTGSLYNTGYASRLYLYSADRAGSRYYHVMEEEGSKSDNFRSGRFSPSFQNSITSVMINPFVRYKGFELFGTVERASGATHVDSADDIEGVTNQYAGELLYRFGKTENFYVGGRYNIVDSEYDDKAQDVTINRAQIGAGWFMTKNILMKAEYVNQNYKGFAGALEDGKFNGFMLEAAISF
ncbi:hypothetical protein [Pseudotamlana carrageenivorans]|uniref:Porin n=1 Tax=Pseudotamlana carrageenivorans TaxID=2069432 RepID=A0A2I7SKM4_9FLAO|nr:hypothetical protein [Tamlana carrageenivorans]AUS06441.1 hypothetical protein C1A40_13745 [Tamlana carrageenivorans]